MVRFVPSQRVDHKQFGILSVWDFRIVDAFHVSDINQWSNPVSEDRQVMVIDDEGDDVEVAHLERHMRFDGF